eukprot:15817190-Heterocapsa_arctica.AAC.2
MGGRPGGTWAWLELALGGSPGACLPAATEVLLAGEGIRSARGPAGVQGRQRYCSWASSGGLHVRRAASARSPRR